VVIIIVVSTDFSTRPLSLIFLDLDLVDLEGEDLLGDYDTESPGSEDLPEDGQVVDPYYYSDYDYSLLTDEAEKGGGGTIAEPSDGMESNRGEEGGDEAKHADPLEKKKERDEL
jgi:hypothetical protein